MDKVAGLYLVLDGKLVLVEARKLLGLSVVPCAFEETCITGELLIALKSRLEYEVDWTGVVATRVDGLCGVLECVGIKMLLRSLKWNDFIILCIVNDRKLFLRIKIKSEKHFTCICLYIIALKFSNTWDGLKLSYRVLF